MQDIILDIHDISKTFRIPKTRKDTLREHLFSFGPGRYEEFKAVHKVSFQVRKGEVLGIVGPNGSGKSTLLKMIAGIFNPDSGNINMHGSMVPFLELGVGFNPELSGRENIFLNAIILGMTRKEVENKFQSIVDFSELEDFLELKLKNYSSGMQMRLAFAIAIHTEADLYLLDEVMAVGDEHFQKKCFNMFEDLLKQNKSFILVSHDLNVLLNKTQKCIFVNHGKVVMMGNTKDVIQKYKSFEDSL